jgi:CRP/FNR family transcriptional regulator, nitrogen fixation regulation protein
MLLRPEVNDSIYHCGDPALYWHLVVTGAARKCAFSWDGRRQIVDFLLPGDLFGFGAHEVHCFSTEVIAPRTSIVRYPRHALEQLAESDREVSRCIREMAFEAIVRLQTRTLILGRTSALARVSAFLLEWADRGREGGGAAISLPMSRYDIADYLAMAVETVSRALTALRLRQVITFRNTRHLTICDRRTLEFLRESGDEETEAV